MVRPKGEFTKIAKKVMAQLGRTLSENSVASEATKKFQDMKDLQKRRIQSGY